MFDKPPTSKYEMTKPEMAQKKGNSLKANVKVRINFVHLK